MTVNRITAIVSSAVVIVAIAAGLYLGGSPGEQRMVRMDERRVQDLNQLANAVQIYWQQQDELPANLDLKPALAQLEERLVREALSRTGGNRTKAAELLDISRNNLLHKIKSLNLTAEE